MPQLLLLLAIAILAYLLWRTLARQRRQRYIASYPYRRLLDAPLAARHPQLGELQRGEVLAGLRDYFLFCQQAGRRKTALPSQAVDAAWHEFILLTRQYDKFCGHAFGRFLHHSPAQGMETPTEAGEELRRAWRLACAHEEIDPKRPARLPRLFALDATLAIPGGFICHLERREQLPGSQASAYCACDIESGDHCDGNGDCDSGGGGGDSGGGDGGGGGGD